MADTYEKDLAQKTSLTTSDYIRVVGSDNVSYKQQVSNVKSALGINALNNSMGNIQYYYKNIGASYSTLKDRLEAFIAQSDFPTERLICGVFLSGSYHYASGYLDANKNGGFVVINFAGGGMFRVQAGVATQI